MKVSENENEIDFMNDSVTQDLFSSKKRTTEY